MSVSSAPIVRAYLVLHLNTRLRPVQVAFTGIYSSSAGMLTVEMYKEFPVDLMVSSGSDFADAKANLIRDATADPTMHWALELLAAAEFR